MCSSTATGNRPSGPVDELEQLAVSGSTSARAGMETRYSDAPLAVMDRPYPACHGPFATG